MTRSTRASRWMAVMVVSAPSAAAAEKAKWTAETAAVFSIEAWRAVSGGVSTGAGWNALADVTAEATGPAVGDPAIRRAVQVRRETPAPQRRRGETAAIIGARTQLRF